MRNKLFHFVYPIVAVLIAGGIALFLLTRPARAPVLASGRLAPERAGAEALLAEWKTFGLAGPQTRTDSFAAALDLYQTDNYPAAEAALRQYLEAYTTDSTAQFYLGLSLLYQEKNAAALALLSPLTELDGFDRQDDACWYAALAATNVDQPAALRLFGQISRDAGSPYRQSAASVLAAVRLNAGPAGFRVRQSGVQAADRVLSSALEFVVQPAWWQTAATRSLLLLCCLGGAIGLLAWRKREKQRMVATIEQAVAQRTQSLMRQKDAMEQEKRLSEELLLNILPAETAAELKKYGHSDTRRYEQVTVLFCDFQEFTRISEELSPEDLVASLGACFEAYDRIVTTQGLEKIKTVGDCYICAGGLKGHDGNEAIRIVHAGQAMLEFLKDFNARQAAAGKPAFEARIGIHTGTVVAGIVGIKKYAYDIWGDTVNIAARMEQTSEGGRINISGSTYELVKEHFTCEYRGRVEAKGKGAVDMYFVT